MDNTLKPVLRAIDGYTVTLLDGGPMPLGGLGPPWAVFDADRHADVMARPLAERHAQCPWGLYRPEVQDTQAVG